MHVIDTHQHLWDLNRFRLPWLSDVPELAKSFLIEDFLAATNGLEVVQSIYMEVDLAPEQHVEEAEYVVGLCAADDNPLTAAVVAGRPGLPGFRPYMEGLKQYPCIKGIRQVLHTPATPPGYALQEPFLNDVRWLGEQGWSFDICIRREELSDAVRLADECPDVQFILDHCGNADLQAGAVDDDTWRRDLATAAKCDNLACKISGFIRTLDPAEKWSSIDIEPVIDHVYEAFGADRVMFGGDWPVCTLTVSYAEWLGAVQQAVASHSIDEQQKLFSANSRKFYRLD